MRVYVRVRFFTLFSRSFRDPFQALSGFFTIFHDLRGAPVQRRQWAPRFCPGTLFALSSCLEVSFPFIRPTPRNPRSLSRPPLCSFVSVRNSCLECFTPVFTAYNGFSLIFP